jgi:hypothetical protein
LVTRWTTEEVSIHVFTPTKLAWRTRERERERVLSALSHLRPHLRRAQQRLADAFAYGKVDLAYIGIRTDNVERTIASLAKMVVRALDHDEDT